MNCNILLLGQTGVGKSSLLNYLAGENLAEAGISSGIGGLTKGIKKYPLIINNQKCLVSDSEGLELAHSDYWLKLIDKELFNRDISKTEVSAWYHIVIYCIGANGGRVQDFELKIIDRIISEGYGLIIAFTKADVATDEELVSLQEAIEVHCDSISALQFVPVCSVKSRMADMEGKEAISNAIIDSWGESICNRLPSYIFDSAFDDLSDWYDSVYEWIGEQKFGMFNKSKSKVLEELNSRIQFKQNFLNRKVVSRQQKAFKEVSEVYQLLSQVIDIKMLTTSESAITPKISKLQEDFVFEDNNVGKSLLTVASVALVFAAPVVGIPLTILNSILGFGNDEKRREELLSAFNHQYLTLIKFYQERKQAMSFILADAIGYLYARLEMGICFLKGRGVEKNITKFCEYMQSLALYIEDDENDYSNGRAEYYIAYMYFLLNLHYS